MEFTVSLGDLALFVLFVLGVAVLVYLIMTLRNLSSLIRRSDQLLEKNADNIQVSLDLLPEVVENVHEITGTLRDGVDKAETAIDHIGGSLSEAVATVATGAGSIAVYTKIIREMIHIVTRIMSSRSKK